MRTTVVLLCAVATAVTAYPKVDMSYRAVGNFYLQVDGGGKQVTFEENYEHGTERSALTTFFAGINSTVVDYHLERQAFLFEKDRCQDINTKDRDFEIDVRAIEVKGTGQYVMPIHQLLSLNTSYLVQEGPVEVNLEGHGKVNRWTFKIENKNVKMEVTADWTQATQPTASAYPETPVRFEVKRSVYNNKTGMIQFTSQQTVTVDLFTHGEYSRHVFRPHRGVFCANRQLPNTFPGVVLQKLRGLRTRVEQVVKAYSSIRVVDTWFDPSSKLFRINYSPIREQVQKGIHRIVSHVQGVVYEMSEARKCAVKEAKKIKEKFDPQTVFNAFDSKDFNMEAFFGIGKTQYNSVGEIIERGIPCNLYQGLRQDWPPEESGNIVTLWEWCLADQTLPEVKFELNGFPLISLNIYVKESPYKETDGFYYQGLQLAYNFYDVRNTSKEYLDNLAFDIQQCFEDSNQKRLEFRAQVREKVIRELLEANDRHKEHVAAWTEAIIKAAKVHEASLRVADVKTHVTEEGVEVQFVLLGRHPDLPAEVEEISLDKAVDNVRVAVDDESVAVSLDLGPKQDPQKVNLKAQPGTLRSKVIEDDSDGSGSSSVTAVTMGAVAVVMLVLGVAIGAAFIFRKKRHLYQRV